MLWNKKPSLGVSESSSEKMELDVVAEEIFYLIIDGIGEYKMMFSSSNLKEMAVGFAFTAGFIKSIDDIKEIETEKDKNRVKIVLKDNKQASKKRETIMATSGGHSFIDDIYDDLIPVADSMTIDKNTLLKVDGKLSAKQHLRVLTRASHAAGIFNDKGEMLFVAEDIGRHNALDKVIGKALFAGHDMKSCGVALSSRVSFEMAFKAAKAGFEIITAASAPSSLAVDLAEKFNITLCTSLKKGKCNVFSHEKRLK